jgi:hypothetical protein
MTEKYTVQDLIQFSYSQQPVDFEDAFKGVLADKLAGAIDLKKQEMAQNIFPEEQEEISGEEENFEESENDLETDTEGQQDDQDS